MVAEIPLPPSLRTLSVLPRVDYADAWRVPDAGAEARTAEAWARTVLEEAPASMRASLRRGWCALGLRLGATDDPSRVLGWAVRRTTPDHAVLTGRSAMGMNAELVFARDGDALLFATLIRLRNPLARRVWAMTAAQHRRVVRHLLTQAQRRTVRQAAT